MSVSCPARAGGTFSCLPAGEAYPGRQIISFHVFYVGRDNYYLVHREVWEIA
jgi:hypothetical protein